ncbi:MAG TPA: EscU/YscU/HrcU family type III secretion system export apparatus switch protein [Acidimicrobiia bacterium]|nr:EscU/YscU/HrcU family type III secretion system export apparatus switch protein [Acidimicrobiia bacterium]
MAAGDSSDKTEKPTPKRLKEAREKGQVAKTPDLVTWVGLLATTTLLQLSFHRAASVLPDLLQKMALVISHPDLGAANKYAANAMWQTVGLVAPMLLGMMVIGLLVNVAQVGFKPTSKKLKPDFGRLNPFKGIKKMVGPQTWWELGKALAKTALLIVVAWPAFTGAMHTLTGGNTSSAFGIAGFTAKTALTVLRNVSAAGLIVAAADYAYQKRRTTKQLRMTRQELREEMKQQEGNPEMKRSIRTRAMAVSRNQMIRAVSLADVVVVNPTHYAVAIKYDSAKGAPQVVAKGAGSIAAAIRTRAERNGIPIVHEAVLTRTLYAACDIGQFIPPNLYEAVAHLLAFVFGLRAKGRAEGFHEMPKPVLL